MGLLDSFCSPAQRVTRERVAAYIEILLACNRGYTVLCRIQELYDAIRVMAPREDWAWLRKMGSALRSRTIPARSKEGRIQPPSSLIDLGFELMAKADEASDLTTLQRAVLFRDGLMIAFLAYRPLRISNFAAIIIGRHLEQLGHRYGLRFEAEEMKDRRIFEAVLPDDLLPGLDRYLQHYRIILLTGGDRRPPARIEALWVSETATQMAVISIHNRIRRRTGTAFGVPVCPHLFRDGAATETAIEGPAHVRVIKAILGHSTLATSEKHYNQARSLEASRTYGRLIGDLRQRARSRRRRKTRKKE